LIVVAPHRHKDKQDSAHSSPDVVFSSEPPAAPTEESDPAAVGASRAAEEPGAGSLAEQLQQLLTEKQELMNTLVRRQADFDNYRKRVDREREQDRHRAVESLVERLLPVLDAFDRALAGQEVAADAEYRKGFDLIRRQLWDALSKQGLVRIESTGKEFNPHFHHAIQSVQTSEHAEGIVIEELQPGYLYHERVLRPAMVRVAAAPEPKSAHASKLKS
jgi:molecular chaperone GrpE